MEYCLICGKVREILVRALVKVGGEAGEFIGVR
jgi:hypothetical protein